MLTIVDKEMPITSYLVMDHLVGSHHLGTKIRINPEQVPHRGKKELRINMKNDDPPFVIQNKKRRYLKSCTVRYINNTPLIFIYTLAD